MADYKESALSPKEGVEDVTEYVQLLEAKLVELEQALAKSKGEGGTAELKKVQGLLDRANADLSESRKKEAAAAALLQDVVTLGGIDKLRTQAKELANLQTALANETENRRRETVNLREAEKCLSAAAQRRNDYRAMYECAAADLDQVQKNFEETQRLLAAYKTREDERLIAEARGTAMTQKSESEKTLAQKLAASPAIQTLKIDATDAGWRLAGSQFVKLTKEPLVALLSQHLGPEDESLRARIAAFLDSEIGAGLLAGVLSAGLSAMPTAAGSVQQQLARELRVKSMATVGDVLADILMGPLRTVAVMYLQAPAPGGPAQLEEARTGNVLDFEGAREKVG